VRTPRGRRRLAGIGAVLFVVVTGCSDDGGDTGSADGDPTVTVVSQNLLHGTACPEDSDRCDLPTRVGLFVQQLSEAGCPQVVGIQEANQQTVDQLVAATGDGCTADYEVVWDDDPSLDREVVLTTEPVLASRRIPVAGPLRTALWVRTATDVGILDYVSSHLASGSDDRPCDPATCPPPCETGDSVNTCQARQLVEFAEEVADPDSVVVVGGDLNAQPGEPTIEAITAAGFVDSHLAAGNPECAPETGDQCTSGRVDDAMTDLEDPRSTQSERIDHLFVGGARNCTAVDPTGLFNGAPADGALAFPADHTGVQATLACPTTGAQVATASTATVAAVTTTTSAPGAAVDPEAEAAITEAFTNLFDGSVTDVEVKLSSLESAAVLRPFFLESYEATRDVAAGIRVRIDAIEAIDATTAAVTYTLLLDGNAVLDHLPGEAVLVDGRWLVTLRTYCDVSTQGAETIPEPCR
jgi:endonuclease/exonuclease/phosphatase family metal-dependent hydrolase